MPDVQEVFRMATQKIRPDQGALDRQHREQRRRAVMRRAQVYGLVAAMLAVVIVVAIVARPQPSRTITSVTPPPVSLVTTPPIGAQLVGLNGTPIEQIAGIPSSSSSADLSTDGSKIVFSTYPEASPNRAQIATIAADGTDFRQLTTTFDDARYPRWSPDGTKIAYVTLDANSEQHIFVMDADGSNVIQLTRGRAFDTAPAWSPDGSTIAFQRGSGSSSLDYSIHDEDIWSVPADGSGDARRLIAEPGAQEQPDWSPDGTRIAFGDQTGLSVVRVADPSKIDHLDHLSCGFGCFMPRWSPQGDRIAYLVAHDDGFAPFPNGAGSERSAPLLRVFVGTMAGPTTVTGAKDLGVTIVTNLGGVSWDGNGRLLVHRYS